MIGVAAVVVLAAATPAQAHTLSPGLGAFWNGVFHPLLALEQALAVVALGVLLARATASLTAAVLASLLASFTSALVGAHLTSIGEAAVVAPLPLIAAGAALIDPGRWFSARPAVVLVPLGALMGWSMGGESPSQGSWAAFALGTGFGTFVIAFYSMEAWLRFHRPWFDVAVRIFGSWLAAIGVMLLGATFAA